MARARTPAPAAAPAETPVEAPATVHRLAGLEPDNLLAFLALLGLLRALDAEDAAHPDDKPFAARVSWSITAPPLRPHLHVAFGVTRRAITERAAAGVARLAAAHDFAGRDNIDYPRPNARAVLVDARDAARADDRARADLLAALMSDGAVKEAKDEAEAPVAPTPLCFLFGQGHQHFLQRLALVPATAAPPPRGRGKAAVTIDAATCLEEALFRRWHREDPTFSFRWDPDEAVRYALMAGDPTDPAYKMGAQHGANRLAALGLAALPLVPEDRAGRIRPAIPGGAYEPEFSFAWPIHAVPIRYAALTGLLSHPGLRRPDGLKHLGVDHVVRARRISVGKFMNVTRAEPLG